MSNMQTIQDRVQSLLGAQTVTIITLQTQLEEAHARIAKLEEPARFNSKSNGTHQPIPDESLKENAPTA